MSLSVNFMGLSLKNPIIAAAGPWCRDAAAMQKAIDAGAAAVVTETITLEKSHMVSPRIFYRQGEVYNTTLYSTQTLEEVEQEAERLHKGDAFLICNIRGTTPSELRYLASRMQRLGADALELCCFTPIGTKLEDISIRPEEVGEMVRGVTSAVEIPVMVRLPHHAALNPAYHTDPSVNCTIRASISLRSAAARFAASCLYRFCACSRAYSACASIHSRT